MILYGIVIKFKINIQKDEERFQAHNRPINNSDSPDKATKNGEM